MLIPYGKHFIDGKDVKSVSKALNAPLITQGPTISRFEKAVCKLLKVKYAVAVNSCTSGLQIAIQAVQKKKMNFITSPVSFASTANAILFNNSKPIFTDINPESLNLDIVELKKKIKRNKNLRGIIPVHLGGAASGSKELYRLAKKKKLIVIEDAAHSFGSKYEDGFQVGSCKHSDMSVFSFHPVKTITTGEGGMITTNSRKLYQKLIVLRNHGIQKDKKYFRNKSMSSNKYGSNPWYYEMIELGFNYRITDLQCALGLSQLKKLKKIINYRRKIAKTYDFHFRNFKNLKPLQKHFRKFSSNHLYIIKINFKNLKMQKNQIMKKLKSSGISTQVHYIPTPLHPYYQNKGYKVKNIPNSINYYNDGLSIPIHLNLKKKDIFKIIKTLKKIIG